MSFSTFNICYYNMDFFLSNAHFLENLLDEDLINFVNKNELNMSLLYN